MRSNFDQKIEKASHAPLNVSSLIRELASLRRNEIAFLETQLASQPQSLDGIDTAKILTAQQAKDSAEMFQTLLTRPVHEAQTAICMRFAIGMGMKPHSNRKPYAYSITKLDWNRFCNCSSKNELSKNETVFITGTRHPHYTECCQSLIIFGGLRDPHHEELSVIKSSHTAFDCYMNNCYYRLFDVCMTRMAEVSKRL